MSTNTNNADEEIEQPTIPWGIDTELLAPSSLSTISDTQLKTFAVGKNKKSPFQKHKEEVEAKKKREEEEAQQMLSEFTESFGQNDTPEKTARHYDKVPYSASSRSSSHNFAPPSTYHREDDRRSHSSSSSDKRKRALDELKEEFSYKQEERHKIGSRLGSSSSSKTSGSYREEEEGDPNSTSLYVANLSTTVTENQLHREFDRYGEIIQVRIIPKDSTSTRPTTYGFVSFVDRKDAEYAKERMQGREFCGFNLRISWGKAVKPNLMPPSQQHSSTSSSSSSHHQHHPSTSHHSHTSHSSSSSSSSSHSITPMIVSDNNKIEVEIPTNSDLIDKLATNVVKFGIQFEKLVGQKDSSLEFINNSSLPENTYYRWRIYSLLQGDTLDSWRTSPFQMAVNGPTWYPPSVPSKKHREDRTSSSSSSSSSTDKRLSSEDKETFEDMLRTLTSERNKIKLAMGFALDHADVSSDIIQSLFESLIISDTPTPTKLARLYLLSDILHNSSARVPNASSYRRDLEGKLSPIFESFREAYRNIGGRITAENFKGQILRLLRIWEGWSLYPTALTTELHDIFLYKEPEKSDYNSDSSSSSTASSPERSPRNNQMEEEEDIDGVPINF